MRPIGDFYGIGSNLHIPRIATTEGVCRECRPINNLQILGRNMDVAAISFTLNKVAQGPSIAILTISLWSDSALVASIPSVAMGLGLGLQWQPTDEFNVRLDYGIPLIAPSNEGNSLQENGIYFSVTLQPF